ncbi:MULTISPECIES: hypothetical protein [unclassified Shewanella]|uniref:hypothetical protein n=1 Tax=unclassified Shewanella TaxID=196818 RepID=UPI001BC44A49|nr:MULTISPECIES: hypothetical protein [unclassified Shewanella]GIU16053.1 hypothetical protein TUM4444_28270 [Shewanella sp. MBTL60-112-B1]GIU33869.1 hypothetical protein TUM4445_21710 [Shewanella sp. MBTL60-112-B2]
MHCPSKILLLVAITGLSTPALANAPKSDVMPTEEQVDIGLKNFGYLTGLALGCVAAEQSAQLEAEAMNINSEISRTLGGNRAFLYAASFGYGSNIELNEQECTEALINFEKRAAAFQQDTRGEK